MFADLQHDGALAGTAVSTTLLGANWLSVGARDAKLLHAEVQCGSLDSQSRSSTLWTGHHPPGLLKNLAYVLALHFLQSNCLRGFCLCRSPQARQRRL